MWKTKSSIASRKLVLILLQVDMATRKLAQTISAILPGNEKWIAIDANPSHGGALSIQVSKMVTKMVRHHDQDEPEQDGSYHWDTVGSVLLKAFARYGAQKFSEDHWIWQ